jgi:hypothetical protein
MRLVTFIFFLSIFSSCSPQTNSEKDTVRITSDEKENIYADTTAKILHERFALPTGYERVKYDSASFAFYLQHLPLKPHGSYVHMFNGKIKYKPNVYCAVVDQAIDPVDLQQCADAVMRLRGEYLFSKKRYNDIHFNFVSDNKPHTFKDYSKGDYSYKKFRSYMKYVFSYANTASLKNELQAVSDFQSIMPGDIFIQSGSPYGHAVIVIDVAKDQEGNKMFMLAQSYMPAQETQVLINPNSPNESPWYSAKSVIIETPEWTFNSPDLRRFKEN